MPCTRCSFYNPHLKPGRTPEPYCQTHWLLQGPLAFVAMRLALDELASATSETPVELPPIVSRKLYEVVAVVAMQFRGYIFKVNEPQVCTTSVLSLGPVCLVVIE